MAALENLPLETSVEPDLHEVPEPVFTVSAQTRQGERQAFDAMMADPDNISPKTQADFRFWADQHEGELNERERQRTAERQAERWRKVRMAIQVPLARLFGL